MSSLIGESGARWSLTRAVDALGDAARQAGVPGLVWIAGVFYPAVSLSPVSSAEQILGKHGWSISTEEVELSLGLPLLLLVLLVPVMPRLWVGLARISTPMIWSELCAHRRKPRLRDAWRAGKGLTFASLGLWLQVLLLMAPAAIFLVIFPALAIVGILQESGPLVVLVLPLLVIVAFGCFYMLLLSLLYQLALHSLAQNRRGVASALTHAWRIAKHDPWATARATLVDFVLFLTILALAWTVIVALGVTCIGAPLIAIALPGILGFFGVTRACYWARAYRALGGLSPDDGVPGLDPSSAGGGSEAPQPGAA